MTILWHNLWFTARFLCRNRGYALSAVLAFSLGIGTVVTQFTVINGTLLRTLPVSTAAQIYFLSRAMPTQENYDARVTRSDLRHWKEQQASFEGLTGYFNVMFNVAITDSPQRIQGAVMQTNFLDLLDVQPVLGRGFNEADATGPPVILISHSLWRRFFSGDPSVLGTTLRVHRLVRTIVGVMPKGFEFPMNHHIWCPYEFQPIGRRAWQVFGRLKKEVSLESARAEFNTIAANLEEQYPETNRGYTAVKIEPFTDTFADDETVLLMWSMLGATALVLLIACANVTNLMMAQCSRRSEELSVRTALGASRSQVLALVMTESIVLAGAGALGGILLSLGLVDVIWTYVERMDPPFWYDLSIDSRVLTSVIGTTILAGAVSEIAPALRSSKVGLSESLKDSSRTGSSLYVGKISRALVVFQIATCCSLLIGASLLAKSIFKLKYSNLNFDPDSILSAGAVLVDYPTVEERVAFIKRAESALNEHPEIEAAALLQRYHSTVRLVEALGSYVLIDGESYAREEDYPYVHYNRITTGFFRAMGVEVLEGRDFALSDTPDSLPVVIINKPFASRHWPGQSALGKRLKFRSRYEVPWLTVIGVVPDLLLQGIENRRAPEDGLYLPYYQQPRYLSIGMVLRGKTDNMSRLAAVLHSEMRKLDPNLGLMEVETLREGMDQVLITRNILTNVFLLFGALSLLLASLGLFGVMNFSVGQKGVDIAIRMALGAPGGRLLLSVMKTGMRQLGYGLALGWLVSIGLAGILEAFLYEVEAIDVQVCLVVIIVLSSVCLMSCYLPARRAVLTQPMDLLRCQ